MAQQPAQAPAAASQEPAPAAQAQAAAPQESAPAAQAPAAAPQEPAPAAQAQAAAPQEPAPAAQAPAAVAQDSTAAAQAPAAVAQDSTAAAQAPAAVAQDSTAAAQAPAQAAAPQDSAAAQAPVAVAQDSTAATQVPDSAAQQPAVAEPVVQKLTGTEIKGDVHGMLSADKSPYLVTGDININNDQALFIQAGVTIYFEPGTGIYVNNGSFTVAGNQSTPVVLRSSSEPAKEGSWKGIYLTGDNTFNLHGVEIADAEVGIAIEKGNLNLQSAKIRNTASRGVYVRDGEASIIASEFTDNKGVALHAANYAKVNADNAKFSNNNFALLNSELANTSVHGSDFHSNEFAVVGKENNQFKFHNTSVHDNKVGAAGIDIMDPSVISSVSDNDNNFESATIALLSTLPSNPEIPGVDKRPFSPNDKISVLAREEQEKEIAKDSSKTWTILGNVMLGGNYHNVATRRNKHEEQIIGNDTIGHNSKYKNTFQVPGFGGELAAYLYMQSNDGKTIEFNTDITVDSWNHFSPNPVTLSYKDNYNNVILGDHEKTGGEIYMSNLPLFGIDYTLSLLKNNADESLFEVNGFFGEAKRSMVPGDRHPYIYKTYIEDGTAQAQRLAYGGSFKWAPVRRFDAKVGAIYASDELVDPLLRDGASSKYTTVDPMIDAFTMYADGNWLFFPGDIELNGQIAVGRADTTDVIRERAINTVFSKAGLNVSSFSKIRSLLQNSERINALSHNELVEIFGDNGALRDSEMKDSLRTLIKEAKTVQNKKEDDRDDDRILGETWDSQNFALSASLNWNINKTHIYGQVKYIGEDFYSAGSDNQLSDYRQFLARLDQDIFKFWTLGVHYELNVENAANGSKKNHFGLSEGSHWGLLNSAGSEWLDKHELDIDRAKYTQNMGTDQKFNIGKNVTITAGYNFQYQKQYRPYQLHGVFMLEDGIYKDEWFRGYKNKATTEIIYNDETTLVDSLRWAKYNSLYGDSVLASRFQERVFKHTFFAGVSVKAFNTTFKADGRWTIRADGSQFLRDSLVEDFDFNDTTWAKLGYYFGGADYFEHTYPLSATTSFKGIQNRFAVTPRFKYYKRDNMDEAEITFSDEFEMPLKDRFFVLGLNAEFRYMSTTWEEGEEDFDESESDILGSASLRVNHTKHFYSVWNVGASFYNRPDDLSSEYRDIFGGIQLNYIF
jgi:hypothetical protein